MPGSARRAPEPDARPRPGRMLAVTAAWGACFVVIRWGLRDSPVLWFAALRALVAGAVLLPFSSRGPRIPKGWRVWLLVFALSLTNVTLAFGAMFAGVAGLATGTAAVLANAQPLLILLPAWWFYGERVRARGALALVAGFGGLILTTVSGGGGRGAALSLLAAGGITAGTLLVRQVKGADVLGVAAWHFLIGGVLLAALAGVVEGAPGINWTPRFVGVVLFLGVIGTAGTFVIWFQEVLRSPLAAVTAWTFLVPVFGIGFGAWLLRERPSGWSALGLGLVLGSLWIAQRAPVVRCRRDEGSEAGSE